ncbi:MAG: ABC transporter permease, partial [Salinispira sp.]
MKFSRLLFIVFFLLPILYLIVRSVGGIWSYPALLPQSWNFRAVRYLIENVSPILKSLRSSLFYSLATVVITLLFSIAPAKVLARRNFPGKIVIESLLLAPLLVPGIVFSLGLYPLLLRIGLIDNAAGVIFILSLPAFPYMLRALTAGFES